MCRSQCRSQRKGPTVVLGSCQLCAVECFAAGDGLCDAILGRESVSLLLVHSSLANLWFSAWRVPYQKIQWIGATREGLEQEPW